QVDVALIRREGLSSQATISEQRSLRISPLAPQALVPFANSQIDAMVASLAALPAVAGPGGTPPTGDPTPAAHTAGPPHPRPPARPTPRRSTPPPTPWPRPASIPGYS